MELQGKPFRAPQLRVEAAAGRATPPGSAGHALAARLPGGSAWKREEAPMWKRSEVERLTGLTRHAIQDLCNQNTAADGLGFWRTAIAKPGYSRFDEGDLLAFYLVRQLTRAGFALAEVEPAVFELWEDDEAFGKRVARKAELLQAERVRLDARSEAIDVLGHAARELPAERLRAIVDEALGRSLRHAVARTADELDVDPALAEKIGARLQRARTALVAVLSGEAGEGARLQSERVGALLGDGDAPRAQRSARRLVRRFAQGVAERAGEKHAEEDGRRRDESCAAEGAREQGENRAADLVVCALARVLSEPENGVPIELVYGKGSFKLLSSAATACAEEVRACAKRREG